MNIASDLVMQAEMDYRFEKIQKAWGPVRRRRTTRRHDRTAHHRSAARDSVA